MKTVNTVLAIVLVACLAAGTIVERFQGNEGATAVVYGSWWFMALLAVVALGAIAIVIRKQLWHRPELLMLALSVPVILLGGALTKWTGQHGSMTLLKEEPTNEYTLWKDSTQVRTIPFTITLEEFKTVPYPGTMTPMDFESHIVVTEGTSQGEPYVISMNNILKKRGYRFYQEDFDDEGNSILSVAHDPWGIAVTYLGYALMMLGFAGLFISRRSHFRRLLRGAAIITILLIANNIHAADTPPTLPRDEARQMGQMYIFYKGRVCPLQTFAKDFTTKLYGNATYKGLTAEQVLSGWMYYPTQWYDEPMIKVKGDDVKRLLGADERYVALADFTDPNGQNPIQTALDALPPMSPKAKNLKAANEKESLLRMLTGGTMMKMFPLTDQRGQIRWYAQNDKLPETLSDDEYLFITQYLNYSTELVAKQDYKALDTLFAKTARFQAKQAAGLLPGKTQFRAEQLYNALTTGRWLAMMSITLGLLFFAMSLVTWGRGKTGGRWARVLRILGVVLVAMLTVFLTIIFTLKWIAGDHVPMSGGFDSMNLMAIAIGIITLCLYRRFNIAPAIGLLTMGFCLLVAMMSGANPPITHLMPVLRSPLLSMHVTVIMISYALFFFVMLTSLAALLSPSRRGELRRISLLMLYPAETLLALGIIIGALWANISWGNYWSWDPKEVWALVTLIVYAMPLLTATDEVKPRAIGFHLYCFLAFLSVIITYFGVNFLLGGIHAYN
ncbi:MAG: cytochrome c biogenesis protein CcsA [Bacteroidales bacterium]|nr:cytochrome c biogenesis protein CcsA [Bacteroidales bacterium]